jgi:hypothetical protein
MASHFSLYVDGSFMLGRRMQCSPPRQRHTRHHMIESWCCTGAPERRIDAVRTINHGRIDAVRTINHGKIQR